MNIVSWHLEWHVDCLSPSHPFVFSCLLFLFSFTSTGSYFIFNRVQFPCKFHLLMWLLLQMPCPLIGPFIFRDLVCHFQLVDLGLVLCVGLILPCRSFRPSPCCCGRMAFHLSGKVVALHLDNSTVKTYLFNQGGTASPFLPGWSARYWVWPTSTVLLLFQHTFLPVSMWRLIICLRISCFWSGIFSLRWLNWLFSFGAYQRWICWHPPIPLNASIITPWKLHCLWGPWGWMPSVILGYTDWTL